MHSAKIDNTVAKDNKVSSVVIKIYLTEDKISKTSRGSTNLHS